ncbi:flagellar basal body-associated FliL family protein [Paenibacillus sp. JX-17]|uniref:Flagellar protein FliL n=1 Tax=Paenibacillus lacisoli TaxID=3064525 RepID=A0ABT9C990_9BACL|nr:flagellar basal body-associated FliL family protein [Paenibacillus sp. JX-17]MDO7905825.1 flagellar basal body-associated FliL family protein [Paenibacillus sp. JX-17]
MKKMLPWLVTILLSITLIVLAAFLLLQHSGSGDTTASAAEEKQVEKKSADEIVELTSEITDIKTNLADTDQIVTANFAFQLSDKSAKASFEKIKDISIKPIIIQTLAGTKAEELNTPKGRTMFFNKLTNLINQALPEGKVSKTDVTNILVVPI